MTQQAAELWGTWTRLRDERSFESLVLPELPHAMGFARRLGCSAADAEDAVQDALARLAAVRDDSPASVGVRAWLCREVHVRARSRLRSERRRRTREAAASRPPEISGPDASAALRDEVERALADLDHDERSAVELRYLHDLDYREMGHVLGASEGACRQRVHKALARLRARFGDDAAAMVAALPLPAVLDVSALVKGALAKSAAASAAGGGATVMATTTQKLAITAIFAAALGAGGTIAAQRLSSPASPAPDVASADTSHADEIAKRDAEIARLRTQLADASRRRVSPRNADEARHEAPASAAAPSAGVGAAVGKSGAQSDTSPAPAVDQAAAAKQAQTWQDALRQLADPAKRDAAWAEVRNALAGADRTALLAALQTVAFTQDVKLDRTGLRDLLLPSVDAPESPVRLMAWQALINNGIESVDVDKLRGQILDVAAEIRPKMVQRLAWAMGPAKQSIDGPNADAVLKVLDDPRLIQDTVRALQNVKLNDAVVARVLEYAKTSPEAAQNAKHFVLRTLPDKNRDVVAFLLDRAEGGDLTGIEQFQWTIRREDVAYAGERLRKLYDARSDGYTRERLIQTIGSIGDESSRTWLTAINDDTSQSAAVRSAAKSALSNLDRPRR